MAVLGGDNITEASGQVLEIYAVVRNQTLPGETPGLGFDCRGGGITRRDPFGGCVNQTQASLSLAFNFCRGGGSSDNSSVMFFSVFPDLVDARWHHTN